VSTTGQWEELFGNGRKWRVAEELTGTAHVDGLDEGGPVQVAVTFARGEFELSAGTAYRSLLSTNLGRRGLVLQETDDSGSSDIPGSRIAVGYVALDKARSRYGAIW
jgi:hypothetical protein